MRIRPSKLLKEFRGAAERQPDPEVVRRECRRHDRLPAKQNCQHRSRRNGQRPQPPRPSNPAHARHQARSPSRPRVHQSIRTPDTLGPQASLETSEVRTASVLNVLPVWQRRSPGLTPGGTGVDSVVLWGSGRIISTDPTLALLLPFSGTVAEHSTGPSGSPRMWRTHHSGNSC